jgi:Uma2 family endonuclease
LRAILTPRRFTAEEFWAMDDIGSLKIYELIDGQIVAKLPVRHIESLINATIATILWGYVSEHNIKGHVLGPDGAYTMTEHDVYVPDVSFIFKKNMPDLEDTESIISPDLAIETFSPSETPRKVNAKTTLYLNTGTQIVWNVYPDEKVVEVWTKGAGEKLEMLAFTIEDTLDGGDVLPEFTLALRDIFAQIEDTAQ